MAESKQVNVRFDKYELQQLKLLKQLTGKTQSGVIKLAVERLHQQQVGFANEASKKNV